jgi:hypothetical protein
MKALSVLHALMVVSTMSPLAHAAPWGYEQQGAPAAGAGLGQQPQMMMQAPAPTQNYGGYPQTPGPVAGGYADASYGNGGFVQPGVQPGYTPGAATFAPTNMLTYGTLEGFYQYTKWNEPGIDASHGMGLSLMAELFDPFFLHGSFSWATGNGAALPSTYNISTVSVGGGGHFAITERFHIMGEIGGIYASLSADKTNVSFSDGAIYISPAIRFAATESLELKLGLMATSADKYDSKAIDFDAYYKLFSQMDVGVGLTRGDETKAYKAGVRFRW